VFDGTYVWATNEPDTVTRLREDGSKAGVFKVGAQPHAIAFDGANIWVGNVNSGTVSKLRASDGKTLGTFPVPGSPYGIAYDGDHIWVTTDSFINELRLSDGKIVAYLIAHGPTGIAFDGANIWVAIYGDNSIFKL
jgi:sugar lactone lactonase YvrE